MSYLNLYNYNSKIIDKIYQNVDFLFNLEQISRSLKKALGILGVKVQIAIKYLLLGIFQNFNLE